MIHDFYDDSTGAVLREIIRENGDIPDFVTKNASLVPSEAIRADKQNFAWKLARKFPVDTPEDTWLSCRYFEKSAHLIPQLFREDIADELGRAIEIHGLGVFSEKSASVDFSDDDFLVVVDAPYDHEIVKVASEDSAYDLGDGNVRIRAYYVGTPEAVKDAALWFPRGLDGDLSSERFKVASMLIDLCGDVGFAPPPALIEEVRPIKRSHVKEHIGQRIGMIMAYNEEAARQNLLHKTAAYGQVEPARAINTRFIDGYEYLLQKAASRDLDEKFWRDLDALDKAAGLDGLVSYSAQAMANRDIEEDIEPAFAKMAGTLVSMDEVMAKVSGDMWRDLGRDDDAARSIAESPYSQVKLAEQVGRLNERTQRAVLHHLRGW